MAQRVHKSAQAPPKASSAVWNWLRKRSGRFAPALWIVGSLALWVIVKFADLSIWPRLFEPRVGAQSSTARPWLFVESASLEQEGTEVSVVVRNEGDVPAYSVVGRRWQVGGQMRIEENNEYGLHQEFYKKFSTGPATLSYGSLDPNRRAKDTWVDQSARLMAEWETTAVQTVGHLTYKGVNNAPTYELRYCYQVMFDESTREKFLLKCFQPDSNYSR